MLKRGLDAASGGSPLPAAKRAKGAEPAGLGEWGVAGLGEWASSPGLFGAAFDIDAALGLAAELDLVVGSASPGQTLPLFGEKLFGEKLPGLGEGQGGLGESQGGLGEDQPLFSGAEGALGDDGHHVVPSVLGQGGPGWAEETAVPCVGSPGGRSSASSDIFDLDCAVPAARLPRPQTPSAAPAQLAAPVQLAAPAQLAAPVQLAAPAQLQAVSAAAAAPGEEDADTAPCQQCRKRLSKGEMVAPRARFRTKVFCQGCSRKFYPKVVPEWWDAREVSVLADAVSLRSHNKMAILEAALLFSAGKRAKEEKKALDWNVRFRDLGGFAPKSTVCDSVKRVPTSGPLVGAWDKLVVHALQVLLHEQEEPFRRLRP
eukprot:TRINITY_DN485_c0_g1_i13.p1 TRINITY_DN485_c0_g1~~TRINITY_DN485_c0_g1_i13.p1  ORF type:complete len:386 (+),score=88.51 TRINITY_DN485_c0_g1_i13:43-1158(+)